MFKLKNKFDEEKIFYIGMQRCGTKTFGEYFKNNGYKVCSWEQYARNEWGIKIYEGRYLEVIESREFNSYQVFEDGPFQKPEFFKFLYHCFPKSRFVYFHRPTKDWFSSMITHSEGKTLGASKKHLEIHCDKYDRLLDLLYLTEELSANIDKLFLFDSFKHYSDQYLKHQARVRLFFKNTPNHRYFEASLYDEEKFQNLNIQFKLDLSNISDVHTHKSSGNAKDDVESWCGS